MYNHAIDIQGRGYGLLPTPFSTSPQKSQPVVQLLPNLKSFRVPRQLFCSRTVCSFTRKHLQSLTFEASSGSLKVSGYDLSLTLRQHSCRFFSSKAQFHLLNSCCTQQLNRCLSLACAQYQALSKLGYISLYFIILSFKIKS